ncbi:MAG: hypothetical protein AMXMBFR33_51030 [Candidatus Xenobia bacterium]
MIELERSQAHLPELAGEPVALAAITASELMHGVHRADTASRRERRRAFVESILARVPVLAFDLEVARLHAQIWADLRSRGEQIGAHDMMIAATALHHELRLLTRNEREFHRVAGLELAGM